MLTLLDNKEQANAFGKWQKFKNTVTKAAKETIGFQNRKKI